jgi:hypothetical protein
MARRTIGSLLLSLFLLLGSGFCAEPTKTIVIRVFDGKSGHPVVPTGFQVRVDHLTMLHPDWVKANEDGTAELTIPADTSVVALHLAYDNSMEIYVHCDADKNEFGDVWYHVPEIASKGFVAANSCSKSKENDKFKTTAAPGELILFVRQKNLKERFSSDK